MKHLDWKGPISKLLITLFVVGGLENHTLAGDFQQGIQALEWRCIGPHVGVRGTSVAMHPTDRNVFIADLGDIKTFLDVDLTSRSVDDLSGTIWKLGSKTRNVRADLEDLVEQIDRTLKMMPKK